MQLFCGWCYWWGILVSQENGWRTLLMIGSSWWGISLTIMTGSTGVWVRKLVDGNGRGATGALLGMLNHRKDTGVRPLPVRGIVLTTMAGGSGWGSSLTAMAGGPTAAWMGMLVHRKDNGVRPLPWWGNPLATMTGGPPGSGRGISLTAMAGGFTGAWMGISLTTMTGGPPGSGRGISLTAMAGGSTGAWMGISLTTMAGGPRGLGGDAVCLKG